ncbi:hypothetical protein G5S52_21500 [Grimontia sp. S25]|uniref:Uncharacterized protein n=1 Tax=Grimontia sedimenti TaxID=2711294 RepID=A0A6M1RCV1_9GAMM|nr:hypothetical protein [Grimontia sedimenti]
MTTEKAHPGDMEVISIQAAHSIDIEEKLTTMKRKKGQLRVCFTNQETKEKHFGFERDGTGNKQSEGCQRID